MKVVKSRNLFRKNPVNFLSKFRFQENKTVAGWAKRTVFLLLAMICAIMLPGCYLMPTEEEVLAKPLNKPEKANFKTVQVEKSSIEKTVECNGAFISVNQRDIYFEKRGGVIKTIYVTYGQQVKKGDLLVELDTGDLADEIETQKLILKKVELQYEKIKSVTDNKYDLESAKLDVELAKNRLNNLQNTMIESKLTAPIDGMVDYIYDIRQGDYVEKYRTIVRIADPTRLQAAYAAEKVHDFSTGMEVEVTVNSETFEGKVVATPTDMPEDSPLKNYMLVEVPALPDTVEIGDSAFIKAIHESKDNTIVLKRSQVHYVTGRYFVNVIKDGLREERDVEIGIETPTRVEIAKGLEVGELIIDE